MMESLALTAKGPRIRRIPMFSRRRVFCWECRGWGSIGYGGSPRAAYDEWRNDFHKAWRALIAPEAADIHRRRLS